VKNISQLSCARRRGWRSFISIILDNTLRISRRRAAGALAQRQAASRLAGER